MSIIFLFVFHKEMITRVDRTRVAQNVQTTGCRFFRHRRENSSRATVFSSSDRQGNHSKCLCGCTNHTNRRIHPNYFPFGSPWLLLVFRQTACSKAFHIGRQDLKRKPARGILRLRVCVKLYHNRVAKGSASVGSFFASGIFLLRRKHS